MNETCTNCDKPLTEEDTASARDIASDIRCDECFYEWYGNRDITEDFI